MGPIPVNHPCSGSLASRTLSTPPPMLAGPILEAPWFPHCGPATAFNDYPSLIASYIYTRHWQFKVLYHSGVPLRPFLRTLWRYTIVEWPRAPLRELTTLLGHSRSSWMSRYVIQATIFRRFLSLRRYTIVELPGIPLSFRRHQQLA